MEDVEEVAVYSQFLPFAAHATRGSRLFDRGPFVTLLLLLLFVLLTRYRGAPFGRPRAFRTSFVARHRHTRAPLITPLPHHSGRTCATRKNGTRPAAPLRTLRLCVWLRLRFLETRQGTRGSRQTKQHAEHGTPNTHTRSLARLIG